MHDSSPAADVSLPERPKVRIGIVTYNSSDVIADTLNSLINLRSDDAELEIVVRDNGSGDNTIDVVEQMAELYPSLSQIQGGDNIGYGGGHNEIFSANASDIYVVCNPDIIVEPDFLVRALEFIIQNPDVAIMAPRMLSMDGAQQYSNRRDPTLSDLFLRRFLPSRLRAFFRNRMAHYEMRDKGYDQVVDVPFCSGALMVCRSSAYRQIGGFDPRYFLYFEDADISREMRRAGWRTTYNPDVVVKHGWKRAAHANLKFALVFSRNAARYFGKWGWRIW